MTLIKKESGETVQYDPKKLFISLEKSGASEALIHTIIQEVNSKIRGGMTTREIYKMAHKMLKQEASHIAARYRIKKAIMQLGPAGYPFEKFFGELLKAQGYQIDVGLIMKGFCVTHEVDVVAKKESKRILVECKFHNRQGLKSSVQVPLYFKSRYMDILKEAKKSAEKSQIINEGWLVTNTQFSNDALQYGHCSGIKMISWSHPKKGSIKDRITLSGVYPITCLMTLTLREKKELISNHVILCRHIMENPQVLESLRMSATRTKKIVDECTHLCSDRF